MKFKVELNCFSLDYEDSVVFTNWDLTSSKHGVMIRFDADNKLKARRELDKILILLKLYKEGFFQCNGIMYDNFLPADPIYHYHFYLIVPNNEEDHYYNISRSEIDSLRQFINDFKTIPFGIYPINTMLISGLIPYFIQQYSLLIQSLESLLNPCEKGERTERRIKQQFGDVGKKILHNNTFSEDQMMNILTKMYGLRSEIVHGSQDPKPIKFLEDVKKIDKRLCINEYEDCLDILRDYIRRAIIHFHKNGVLDSRTLRRSYVDSLISK